MIGQKEQPGYNLSSPRRRSISKLAVMILIGVGVFGIAIMLLLFFVAFSDTPGEWSMIIYYDGSDRSRFVVTPRFQTISSCRQSAIDRMEELGIAKTGEYECGFRCQLNDPHRANVCEKTQK